MTGFVSSSFPSSSLETYLSVKLRFGGAEKLWALHPYARPRKQSFQDKRMTKLELGHERRRSFATRLRKKGSLTPGGSGEERNPLGGVGPAEV